MCQSKVGELVTTRVVVDLQRLVQRLDHRRFAAAVVHDEMNRHDLLDGLDHDRYQHDLVEVCLDLLDGGEVAEEPVGVFVRRHRARDIVLGSVGIAGIAREIEQADIESLIVHAIDDRRHALGVGADEPVFGFVADALAAVRQRAGERRSGRNDHHLRMQIEAEFQRARGDDAAILGDEANSRARLRHRRKGERCGENADEQ